MASNESILKTLQELMEKLNVQQEEISTLKTLLQASGPRTSSPTGDPGSEGGASDSAPSQQRGVEHMKGEMEESALPLTTWLLNEVSAERKRSEIAGFEQWSKSYRY